MASVHKHPKRELGQYSAILTEQAWSINDLLYGIKHQKMIFDLAGPSEKSLAGKIAPSCTLIELFTEKDCWEQLMNEDEMGRDGGHLNNDCYSLIAIMKRKETPGSLESLPSTVLTVGASFQHILTECCQYDLGRRPRDLSLKSAGVHNETAPQKSRSAGCFRAGWLKKNFKSELAGF